MKQSKEQLLAVLRDIVVCIEQDDSAEGHIRWEWTAERHVLEVEAFYRTGNSQGQGGSVMFEGFEDG